jgi:hypothetical protein
MTTNHAYFEVMCALAASGQLTKTEQVELREHSEHCVLCRNRLLEMRQSGFQLFLARAFKTPSKRLPKGMQERFAARAISEGIPLTSRSAGSGFHALGMVTVLLLVLLLVAAALQDGPFTRPAVEMDVADTSHVSGFLEKERIPSIPNHTVPEEVRASRVLDRQSQFPSSPVSRTTGPRRLSPPDPAARQGRQFTFTLYSRNPTVRDAPFSTTISLPEVVPLLASPDRAPKLTFNVASEIVRRNAPHFLAESEHGALGPSDFRSNIAFAPPGTRSFQGSLDLDAYGKPWQVDFKAHVAAFQPKVVLYATQPGESSQ